MQVELKEIIEVLSSSADRPRVSDLLILISGRGEIEFVWIFEGRRFPDI